MATRNLAIAYCCYVFSSFGMCLKGLIGRRRICILDYLSEEILTLVLYDLNLAEIEAFGRASTAMRTFTQSHVQCTVRRILFRAHLDPKPLFQLLHASHSIISGSSVLLALLPWTFEPGDIDIYTPRSQATVVVRSLHRYFHFELDATATHYLDVAGVRCVYSLHWGHIKVNVVVSTTDRAVTPLFFFHSTAVMNYIDASGIYCAYPRLTFRRQGLLNGRTNDRSSLSRQSIEDCITKYVNRGFRFEADIGDFEDFEDHICEINPYCSLTIRTVRDKHSLFHRSTKAITNNLTRYDHAQVTWCLDQQISPMKDLTNHL